MVFRCRLDHQATEEEQRAFRYYVNSCSSSNTNLGLNGLSYLRYQVVDRCPPRPPGDSIIDSIMHSNTNNSHRANDSNTHTYNHKYD